MLYEIELSGEIEYVMITVFHLDRTISILVSEIMHMTRLFMYNVQYTNGTD